MRALKIYSIVLMIISCNCAFSQDFTKDLRKVQNTIKSDSSIYFNYTVNYYEDESIKSTYTVDLKKTGRYYYMKSGNTEVIMDTFYLLVIDHASKSIKVAKPRKIDIVQPKFLNDSVKTDTKSMTRTKDSSSKMKYQMDFSDKNNSKYKNAEISIDTAKNVIRGAKMDINSKDNLLDNSIEYVLNDYKKNPTFRKNDFNTFNVINPGKTSRDFKVAKNYKGYTLTVLF